MNSQIGIGPMSTETIEAVFRYSEKTRKEIMLIASKNQIDYNGGYVNNWTTKEYSEFIRGLRLKFPSSRVLLCRDHCGPGFNGNCDLEDTYNTLKNDIEQGFDLIHIDFSKLNGTKEEILRESKKAIEYCLNLNPKIRLEIGTEENRGDFYSEDEIESIERDIKFFKEFCNPDFYVVQTGSLIKEINQMGKFNIDFVKKVCSLLRENGIKLKEHNADYLSSEEIAKRNGIVDAMNIAPQLGVAQTSFVLSKCLQYGVDYGDFLEEVYAGRKWEKWLKENTAENKHLCFLIAGHYHFSSNSYKKIISSLSQRENIHESIINHLTTILEHYGGIIKKPWGQEEIIETNERYTVKKLLMKEGHQCSYQYHEKKLETIIVLSGELTIVFEEGEKVFRPGEIITIKPFQKHRMLAKNGDSEYYECSTSELDDVIRMNDDYGRQ